MLDKMRAWLDSTGNNRGELLRRLTSDAVRHHKNVRIGDTSASTGHVHNALLPEGGLQQVVAQHNIHVVSLIEHMRSALTAKPGAQVLNAGQDLMSGKMVGCVRWKRDEMLTISLGSKVSVLAALTRGEGLMGMTPVVHLGILAVPATRTSIRQPTNIAFLSNPTIRHRLLILAMMEVVGSTEEEVTKVLVTGDTKAVTTGRYLIREGEDIINIIKVEVQHITKEGVITKVEEVEGMTKEVMAEAEVVGIQGNMTKRKRKAMVGIPHPHLVGMMVATQVVHHHPTMASMDRGMVDRVDQDGEGRPDLRPSRVIRAGDRLADIDRWELADDTCYERA